VAGFESCAVYEAGLGQRLIDGLAGLNSVRLHGPADMQARVPTFGFTVEGRAPAAVARHLAQRGVFAWSGHFYAVEAIARLGLGETGGLVRVGLCHYNTADEVDRFVAAIAELRN
jgi:selenocysteine lyase/cysteine desulfurase